MPEGRTRGDPFNLCLQLERREDKCAEDVFRNRAEVHSVECARRSTLAGTSNSEEKKFQLIVTSPNVSSSKLAKQGNLSDVAHLIGKNGNISFFNRTVDTECRRIVNLSVSLARDSALIEQLIDEYDSLIERAIYPNLVDKRYERPRHVPAVPKDDLLGSTKHLSSFSSGVWIKSKPVSKNLRRLRLDLQHSAQSIHETRSDQESPDWACRTSLAIEAGTISMASAHMHGGGSTPRHILEAMGSPTTIHLPDYAKVQSYNPGEKEVICLSPSRRCSLIQPSADRRSEGVSQIVRESHATCLVGDIEEMEIAMGEEPSWHDCLQVSPPIDLKKSLSAFPLQVCGQHGRARGRL